MKQVVLGIVNKDNKLLMVERAKKEGNLVWAFPGGKVEEGETIYDACVREVLEETGVNVSIIDNIGTRKHPDTDILITYLLCNYISGEINISHPEEIKSACYKTSKEIYRDINTDIFPPVYEYIKKYIP